jgi:ankyrin repeat protein
MNTSPYLDYQVTFQPTGVWRDLRQPLYVAARRGQSEVVRRLLKEGAAPNQHAPTGGTALHWAAHNEHTEVARLLLAAGAIVDEPDHRTQATPLLWALMNGSAGMMKLLLEAGAAPDAPNKWGETALLIAAYEGDQRAAWLLLHHGADRRITDLHGKTPLDIAIERRHLSLAVLLR